MGLSFEERPPESPFVERIWRTQPESEGEFTSIANSHWQLCVWKNNGKLTMTLRGPETKATPNYCLPDAEHFSIVFKFGTVMPHLPASNFVDGDATLAGAGSKTFWMQGAAWEYPNFDNADVFVNRLVREGMLIREPVVNAALQGQRSDVSLRSVQRRFLRAIGMTHNTAYQIERARHATQLLKQGASILDTVEQTGYSDQPHLTRALKQLIGQTPAQIQAVPGPMSFLFKTTTLG